MDKMAKIREAEELMTRIINNLQREIGETVEAVELDYTHLDHKTGVRDQEVILNFYKII